MTTAAKSAMFARFWAAQTFSQFGQRFGLFALPIVAINLFSASPAQVGYLTASLTVCYLVVGLPAGAWGDRWNKRRTMICSAWVRAAVLALVPLLWIAGALELHWLYLIGIAVGIASVFFDVAYQSVVPFLVARQDIEAANARLEGSTQVAAAGGPAIAGPLVPVVGAPLLIAIDALAYLVCGLLLHSVADREPSRSSAASTTIAQDVREGLSFVATHPVLRRLVATTGASNFFSTIIMTLTPILVLRELNLSATVMGIVLGVGTIGGIAGVVILPVLRKRLRSGATMALGLCLAVASTGLFPLAGWIGAGRPAAAIALLTVGQVGMTLGAVLFNITQVSTRQRVCPPRLLGRMTSSIRFVVWGSMPAAALVAG
ncbi:MFS transporter [Dermatophilus congolensis]|uniref:MFS transporter n=1 Tax=Dermatophilus congolensis TaxID=1863 RepID=UPI001AAF538D|nr:MFS transporter [Dermatophilus congolensis]MBO3152318.1 MFS transporter [Dermatophilus congolensis]MBO3160669.1 MFS transporter [Dermatophilus congolensis]MBO3163607.1 MFS transporter [Dermatophilus congolensis]MBO3177153.1 MFS transporter [Dermatophilus congolensis]